MTNLIFLGNGSAFNYRAYNTAAYLQKNGDLLIFDCGESICNRLIERGVLNEANNIYVFITHLHSDHIGSLEALIYYNEKFLHKRFCIFYPRTKNLHRLLQLTGVDFDFTVYPVPQRIADFNVETVPQKHIPGSYGYFFYAQNSEDSFYFSGDTCRINSRAIKELKSGKIGRVYHEATCSSSPIHTHISLLEKAFPAKIRGKVCLMHFDSPQFAEECRQKGFDTAEVTQ